MGKNSLPMDVNYEGIPSGLGASKAIKEAKALDDSYDRQVESRENQVAIHNRTAAKARKTAGVPTAGFNRGISDTGRDRTRGK